jgi:PEP-CTERM motif
MGFQQTSMRLAALAVLAMATSASATSLPTSGHHDHHDSDTTFDFHAETLKGKTASSLSFSEDGVGLTVKALVNGTPGLVDFGFEGLGVSSKSLLNLGPVTKGESLQLVFNQTVTLDKLILSEWTGLLDHATLSWGTQSVSLGSGHGIVLKTFDLSNAVGTQFTLSGLGALTGFRLAGLQLASTSGVVPEPGTWALMGLGLVGIAAVNQKRRRQG